jgi:hypothetical protein
LRDVYQLLQFEVGNQFVDREDGLKMWLAAMNMLIKQSRTAKNGSCTILQIWLGTNGSLV